MTGRRVQPFTRNTGGSRSIRGRRESSPRTARARCGAGRANASSRSRATSLAVCEPKMPSEPASMCAARSASARSCSLSWSSSSADVARSITSMRSTKRGCCSLQTARRRSTGHPESLELSMPIDLSSADSIGATTASAGVRAARKGGCRTPVAGNYRPRPRRTGR
jgi:hypothetical protein